MANPIVLVPGAGTSMSSSGSQSTVALSRTNQTIVQVVGLVPLTDCSYEECRFSQNCFYNPVFGKIGEANPTYENDFNTFLIDYPSFKAGTNSSTPAVSWILQKADLPYFSPGTLTTWTWSDIATMNSNAYGILYKLGDIAPFPLYTGYAVNWGNVLNLHGEGFYRIKAAIVKLKPKVIIVGGFVVITYDVEETACMTSEAFKLMTWNCDRAHGTVKFETSLTGTIASAIESNRLFNLCGIEWYDSIRVRGFFGHPGVPKYMETLLEHQNGKLEQVNNKALRKYKYRSYQLPRWLHERFEIYAMMADTILVSDYNQNNSDYFIKRKSFRPASGYEPIYLDAKKFQPEMRHIQRTGEVRVEWREGDEGLIKSLCCPCP